MTFAILKHRRFSQKLFAMLNNSIFESFIEKKIFKHVYIRLIQFYNYSKNEL